MINNRINFIKNTLLVIFSIILCLFILELCLRSLSVKYFRESHSRFFEYDPILGWKNKPAFSDNYKMTEHTCFVRINNKGLRSDNIPYDKKHKPRIAFLGDSFTWGFGVDNGKRFSDILQNHYFNKSVEIINAGVVGYGTDQELLFYEMEIKKYKPNMVILAFTFTDVGDILRKDGKPYFIINNQGNIELMNVPVPRAVDGQRHSNVNKKSLLSTKDIKIIELIREGVVSIPIITDFYLENSINRGGINLKLAEILIKNIKSRVEEDGANFLILLIPSYGDMIRKKHNVIFRKLIEIFNTNNIEYLSLLDEIVSNKEKLPYFKNDKHFSEEGHSIAAYKIYRYLKEKSDKYPYLIEGPGVTLP